MVNQPTTALHLHQLQHELTQRTMNHDETVRKLQLELDYTRRAKEAVEDRMAEFYHDNLRLEPQQKGEDDEIRAHISRYQHMFQVMQNQVELVQASADDIAKSLRDDISNLLDEKLRSELSLINRLERVEKERFDLEECLVVARAELSAKDLRSTSYSQCDTHLAVEVPLQQELQRLRAENERLRKLVPPDPVQSTRREDLQLIENSSLVDRYGEGKATSPFDDDGKVLERLTDIGLLTHESIQKLDEAITKLRPLTEGQSAAADEVLSLAERLQLVHSEVKLSLSLLELKLRNEITVSLCSVPGFNEGDSFCETNMLFQRALDSIKAVEIDAGKKLDTIQAQLSESHLQGSLNHSIIPHQTNENPGTKEIEVCVGHKALESLQDEVGLILDRLQAKDATIEHLTAMVEEFKVRERSLMGELNRQERDEPSCVNSERKLDFLMGNCGSDGSVANETIEFEERTVDETIFEESVYEVVTVV